MSLHWTKALYGRLKRLLAPRPRWQQLLAILILLGLLGSAGGLLFAWLGLAPVAASSGHWPITRWFLHFAMRNAVETRSLGTEVPNLRDPALVLKGAGHYATGCAPCHGAPGESRSLVVQHITPEPPFLPDRISRWQAPELFWIVKNGIKFTAMPAWPARQRDDEVWAVVAFLQEMPAMSPARYEQLAFGARADAGPGGEAATDRLRPLSDPPGPPLDNCVRCHGERGLGRGSGAFPKLAGQKPDYLLASLRAFARGERHSGIMQAVAAGLNEAAMVDLSKHYAARPAGPGGAALPDPGAVDRGRRLARQGDPKRGIPSCVDCHGPAQEATNPYYPRLDGQYPDYLAQQLRLFQSGRRGGSPYAHVMEVAAEGLDRAQIHDLAAYYGSL